MPLHSTNSYQVRQMLELGVNAPLPPGLERYCERWQQRYHRAATIGPLPLEVLVALMIGFETQQQFEAMAKAKTNRRKAS